ncbi:hypothetical protein PPL_02387 [Heterostelium album PN500]|uniref:SCP domain-containing protein n=1 Tax=Heterostelium pallidum (strain ATCC 26659 / Pp 5 / PN500) TaxID=670386 RepID=D3AZK5_HETP5|nr:hypothetical protein PPL_02387 [Heterostelium album PN500]EFA85384.1 hypothetical protein PPL_02387 [Heterostelium album PN500]|eukprot:XP_020437493.1 hypothetical protein PPL_02387 [Heterostelium album PN500]
MFKIIVYLFVFITLFGVYGIFGQFNPTVHLTLLNKERSNANLTLLAYSVCLNNAAQAHSNFMSSTRNLTTADPHGGLFQMVDYYGQVDVQNVAQNIGMGYRNDQQLIDTFMKGSQKKNILNPRLTSVGVAVSKDQDGYLYWTQFFANGACYMQN